MPGTRTARWTCVALLAALAAASPAAAHGPSPARYVDCSARHPGDGTPWRPFNSLAQASAVRLRPGSRLLLRRGTSCTGLLAPTGSGSAWRPAVIGAYGRGPLPHVEGAAEDAVLLKDMSHVTLTSLELTNRGEGEARRRGVHVVATSGVAQGVTLRDLWIHDVQGDLAKDAGGSGGIQVDVLGPEPTRFDDLLIERNLIADVSRSGIFVVGTADGDRPRATEPWPAASTRVRVRANRLLRLGGDGIVPLGTVGAVVEHNVVSEGNLRGRALSDPRGMICNAGIWAFHANGTVIQRNEVFAMRFNGCDGSGYDVDYDQDGTIVQYNLSHDNEGGFILFCTDAQPRTAKVRFNLSVDDRFAANQSPCSLQPGSTYEGVSLVNNTFVAPSITWGILGTPTAGLLNPALEVRNNLFHATAPQTTALGCSERCSNNLFSGLPPAGAAAVSADPLFADPGRRGRGLLYVGSGFRLRPGSPAIGAGTPVPGLPAWDYFGRRVTSPPAIGFSQR
ncbi:MAG: right-handed parallel beta-helix repeat-containing protein [Thermoleophilaceae bacterium]|nr:right-handed parallel beta-helix repeat-containing protein [Thermoleophilaceae bacterium]